MRGSHESILKGGTITSAHILWSELSHGYSYLRDRLGHANQLCAQQKENGFMEASRYLPCSSLSVIKHTPSLLTSTEHTHTFPTYSAQIQAATISRIFWWCADLSHTQHTVAHEGWHNHGKTHLEKETGTTQPCPGHACHYLRRPLGEYLLACALSPFSPKAAPEVRVVTMFSLNIAQVLLSVSCSGEFRGPKLVLCNKKKKSKNRA